MDSDSTGPRSDYQRLELLRASPPPAERADAARNRAAVLDAAGRLFHEHGVDGVSMDAIAAAAGVGKGTLFRRFGDKAGLAVALLDARERELQEAILFGPAPLGPNGKASAAQRLEAFVSAYLDYALTHLDLARMSETASAGNRYRLGVYGFWHRHVALLLSGRSADPESDAHTLLAPLAAEHLRAVRAEIGEKRLRESILRNAASFVEYPQRKRA